MELQDPADVPLQGPSVTDQLAQQLRFEVTALGCPRPTPARQAARAQGQNPAEQWGLYVDVKPAGVPAGQLNKLEQRLAAASKEQQAGRVLALLQLASADCRCGPCLTAVVDQHADGSCLFVPFGVSKQMGSSNWLLDLEAASTKFCLADGPFGSKQVWGLFDCVGLTINAQSCCCLPTSSSSSPCRHSSHAQGPPWLMQAASLG